MTDDIAKLITEDPDIFCESLDQTINNQAMDKPLTGMEIQKQSRDMSGDNNIAAQELAKQLKGKQDLEKKQQLERQRLVTPQFNELQQEMQKLNSGITQGKQDMMSRGQQFQDLENEMTGVNSLIGSLSKSV